MSTQRIVLLFLLLGLTACSAQRVIVEAKRPFNPGSADRVAWANGPLQQNPQVRDTSIYTNDRAFRRMVEEAMDEQGYRILAAGSAADWLLDYRVIEQFVADSGSSPSPRDYALRAGAGPGEDPHALRPENAPGKDDWHLQVQLMALTTEGKFIRRAYQGNIQSEEGLSAPPLSAIRDAFRRVSEKLLLKE